MLVAKKALESITEAFLKSVNDYGLNIKDEDGGVACALESVLAEQGIIVEEEVSFAELNNDQHMSWLAIAESHIPDSDKASLNMETIAELLFNKYEGNQSSFLSAKQQLTMVDWRTPEGSPLKSPTHNTMYDVNVDLGNQIGIEFLSGKDEPVMGLMIEVNHGVPMIHIDIEGGDSLIHIHKSKSSLVFTPDTEIDYFERPDEDDLIYPSLNAQKIRA
ncbi:hypothetical protein BM526_19405 (plasmid) [Alteromonas mediterranea]|uniref:hypothetical protein n=1 Tax=Alteromonas mediterranea TaxID=314275 RepID=UPI0009035265|nr:hypothetical protein [Alteromonas mediterranea]APE04137.1 hypothetical protein BM526_19405 [Alteromonas mediterranea]